MGPQPSQSQAPTKMELRVLGLVPGKCQVQRSPQVCITFPVQLINSRANHKIRMSWLHLRVAANLLSDSK